MKNFIAAIFFLIAVQALAQVDISQQVVPGRQNSKAQEDKPYVILISADGFRYDYAKKYHADHLLNLASEGVEAASMIPSYPSITFPNHYSIVTGLYPAHHGLVANGFFDPASQKSYYYKSATVSDASWYGGTPLWVLAEQQKMLSASFYWVGSEADIKGMRPTYWYHYNEKIDLHDRVQAVKNWLSLPVDKRPHMITVYFPEVDHASHKNSPDSKQTADAVHFIDSAVYQLTKAVKETGLNVNYVFLSDHGMTHILPENGINLPSAIDTSQYVIANEGVFVNIYAKKGVGNIVNATYQVLKSEAKDYDVYLKSNVPAKLHYGETDDWHHYLGDIILIPKYPRIFFPKSHKFDPGQHGYDPALVKDMHATFYAWGPNFKKGLQIPSFENVNVYPIITKILGLSYTDKIDGTAEVADKIVVK